MTKVTLLIFSSEKVPLGRVKDALIPTLKREFLPRNVEAGEMYWSKKHGNYSCYIEVEVGRELGSILIPSEPPEKPVIVLKEVGKDASDRQER
jgi:hypothetical protein